jgi:hypothetical protein
VSVVRLYQSGPNAVLTAEVARRLMKRLEDHGWVVRMPMDSEVNGVITKEA